MKPAAPPASQLVSQSSQPENIRESIWMNSRERRGALRCQVTTHLGSSGLGSLKLI